MSRIPGFFEFLLIYCSHVRGSAHSYSVLRGGFEPTGSIGDSKGRIEMIVGPMFAGKSTELMRRIRRHNLACRRYFYKSVPNLLS